MNSCYITVVNLENEGSRKLNMAIGKVKFTGARNTPHDVVFSVYPCLHIASFDYLSKPVPFHIKSFLSDKLYQRRSGD